MRFDRFGKYKFRDTNRKRLAFERKKRLERERYPLFADMVAAEQVDVDTEMQRRGESWEKSTARDRSAYAMKWLEARARLRAYPDAERNALVAYWNKCGWPATPTYLLSLMHMYDTGRLDMNPVTPQMTEENRIKVAATIKRLLAEAAARRERQANPLSPRNTAIQ